MNSKLSFNTSMKIINIVFLIVLENKLLECGMGIFGVSLLLYYLLYTLFFGSMQTGIAKMVSVRNNKGFSDNSKRIVKPALMYVAVVGLVVLAFSFTGLFFLSDKLFGMSYPIPVMQIFSVIFLLNGIINVLCGYQSGNGKGLIVNIVNLVSSIAPILFSLFVIRLFKNYGSNVSALLKNPIVKDAYTAMGISIVYLLCTLVAFLFVLFYTIKNRKRQDGEVTGRNINSSRMVANGFLSVHVKLMLHNVFPVMSLVVAVLLYIQSVKEAGLAIADGYTNLGALFTKLLLPILFVFFIYAEYIGREKHRLHIDYRKDEIKIMTMRSQYMIKNTLFMLLPPTMVFAFLAGPVSQVLFAGQDALSAKYLQNGAAILLLTGLAYAMNAILRSFDKEVYVWGVQGLALIAQIVFLVIGFSGTKGNSMLILYSLYFYYGVASAAYLACILRIVRLDMLDILMKLGKYGVAGIIMMILFMILDKFITMNIFLLLLSVFSGYLLYYLTLLALHGISKKDEATLKRTLNYYPVHLLKSRLRL